MKPRYVIMGLVVIGLGVGMYGILLPLRASAQKSHCQSNLKKIGLATMQYIRDYDEKFMIAPKWKSQLQPYGNFYKPKGLVYSCPRTERDYAFNAGLSGARWTQVKHPEVMAMFYEPLNAVNADGGKSWNSSGVHGEGSNVCFHDGHVEWVKTKPSFWAPELAVKRLTVKPSKNSKAKGLSR